MKKILLILVLMFFQITACHAAVQMKVVALEEFKTDAPSETIKVKVLQDTVLGSYDIGVNSVLECQVLRIVDPKRLKRNASFYVKPLSYTVDGTVCEIEEEYYGKYSAFVLSKEEIKEIPAGKVIKKAAMTVGDYFVKGLSMGYSAIEGAVKNEKDNRFKSSVNAVYEDSPFSYIEKGGEIVIPKDQVFLLNFKAKNEPEEDDEEPNYEYKELTPNVTQTQKGYKNNTDSIPSEVNPELLKDTNSIRTEN